MFTRVITTSASAFFIVITQGHSIKIPSHLKPAMYTRCFSSCISLFGIMIGIRTLPLTIFMLIVNTSSFTTGILQYFRLGKPMKLFEIVSMVGCYIGIVLIALGSSEESTNMPNSSYSLVVGYIAMVTSAVCISISSITIYEMKELHFSIV